MAWVKGMPKADADWLRSLPWTINIPDLKLVMVHGGLVPDVSPTKPDCPVYGVIVLLEAVQGP